MTKPKLTCGEPVFDERFPGIQEAIKKGDLKKPANSREIVKRLRKEINDRVSKQGQKAAK